MCMFGHLGRIMPGHTHDSGRPTHGPLLLACAGGVEWREAAARTWTWVERGPGHACGCLAAAPRRAPMLLFQRAQLIWGDIYARCHVFPLLPPLPSPRRRYPPPSPSSSSALHPASATSTYKYLIHQQPTSAPPPQACPRRLLCDGASGYGGAGLGRARRRRRTAARPAWQCTCPPLQ